MSSSSNKQSLDLLQFTNQFIQQLPGDGEIENFRRQVYGACYSLVSPRPVSAPKLLAYSKPLAADLGLSETICESDDFVQVFSGNRLAAGMHAYAMCYGGHQFGQWAGQLGDGRAINLGELISPAGQTWALQLKGAGPTPYSRSADGLAVLRSSLREFLCSEAMFHLGVPTTRALSLVLTGESVWRDMFYDGNPQQEPGAIVCRVAPSFIRFGNFEIFAARNDVATLRTLLDFTIKTQFPHLGAPSPEVYLQWFSEVCEKTAVMIVGWQRVGFVHGVMNTDNMSILGLTIDYGPYGWLEEYDPDWTPNTTDAQGRRYRYGHQPKVAYWNLVRLANAIYPLIEQVEPLQAVLQSYGRVYEQNWQAMMAAKLGLQAFNLATDSSLVEDLLALLQAAAVDMTLFYRGLADFDADSSVEQFIEFVTNISYQALSVAGRNLVVAWFVSYQHRLKQDAQSKQQRYEAMNAVNPQYVLRNYLAQQAIDLAETGDFSQVQALLTVLQRPYERQTQNQQFAEKRPEWAKHRAGCSMLSCSS